MSEERVDVVVVGGGAMGSATAWQLARRGVDVTLLERFDSGHANGASHGSSRIFRLTYADQVYIGIAKEAQTLWTELEESTGTNVLSVTGGVDHGTHPHLEDLKAHLDVAGIESHWLTPDEASERWPGMRIDGRGLFHPDSGRLDADRAVAALQKSVADQGGVVRHRTRVTSLTVVGDDAVDVQTEEGTYRARRAVVCAGAWTSKLLGPIIRLPTLTVTQEQPAHFLPLSPELAWPSFTHAFELSSLGAKEFYGGVYGLNAPGEGVKVGFHAVGPVVDPDERDFLPEPHQLSQLQEYARQWLPGVDPDAFTAISCTYTSTTDSNFILDRYGPIVVGAGFSGHGFKFVPAIGRILADLAGEGSVPDSRFSLHAERTPAHG
jgi:sarcosine oxidase